MVLNGIDISSWQSGINLKAVSTDFVIIKATEGTGYVNPYCDTHYQTAKSLGKLLGVYHYAKNGNPEAEAEYFYKNIKGYVGEAILFLDYEEGVSGSSPQWCKRFLDRLKSLTGGVKGVLYTYQAMLNSQNWQPVKDGDYGLWYASYGANNTINGFQKPSAPSVKYWGTPMMFQYSSKTRLSGYNGDLDANMFYGNKETWKAYAKSTKAPSKPNGGGDKPVSQITDTREFGNKTIVGLKKSATHWIGAKKMSEDEKKKYFAIVSRRVINESHSKYAYKLSNGKEAFSQDLEYKVGVGWDTVGFDLVFK